MRRPPSPRHLALALVVALSACGGEEPAQGTRTDDVTQSLLGSGLDQPPTGAPESSTQMRTEGAAEGPVPVDQRIAIAPLGFNYGGDDAPVQVLEMSDYGCSYCRQFHLETWPVIRDQFIETGKVQWKFVPFVNGMFANSQAVTELAECALEADPELFNALSARLWASQSEWKNSSDPSGLARGWAEAEGADAGQLATCLAGSQALRRVATSTALSRQLGVRGTPTFFVLGYAPIQGALPTELFVEILGNAHALATSREGG